MISNDTIAHKYCHYIVTNNDTGAHNDADSTHGDNGDDASVGVGIGAVADGNSNYDAITGSDLETLSDPSVSSDTSDNTVEAILVVDGAPDVDDLNVSGPNDTDPNATDPNATENSSKDGQTMTDDDTICSVMPRRSTRVRNIQKSTNDEEGTTLEEIERNYEHKIISPLDRKAKNKIMDRCLAKLQGLTAFKKKIDKKENIPGFFRHWGKLLENAKVSDIVDLINTKILDVENGIKWHKTYLTEEVNVLDLEIKKEEIIGVSMLMSIHGNKWFEVKRSLTIENSERPYGLFAARGFKKGEIIGLYMGKYRDVENSAVTGDDDASDEVFDVGTKRKSGKKNKAGGRRGGCKGGRRKKNCSNQAIFRDASNTYAFEHLDAQKGAKGKPYMGIHLINDPLLGKVQRRLNGIKESGKLQVANVRINQDFTVETTHIICNGHEILTQYFPLSAYEDLTKIV